MDIERSIKYYDSRVKDLKLEDITSDEYDAEILHKLRDNDPDFRWIFLTDVDGGGFSEDNDNFIMGVDDDLGWLGYLIGRNSQLKHLTISISGHITVNRSLSPQQIDALAEGISRNRSISTLSIGGDLGDLFLQRLGRFLRNNKSLVDLELSQFDIGLASALKLALILRDMSLKSFHVERLCYDSDSQRFIDEGTVAAEVITSLSKHTKLERLHLHVSKLDRNGWRALGTLSSLKEVRLESNHIDDEGVKAFASGLSVRSNLESKFLLSNCCCLEELELSHASIDYDKAAALSSGLVGLHSLKDLSLRNSIVGDDALHCLIAAIENNATLEWLDVSQNTSITAKGLNTLSILLKSERCSLKYLDLRDMRIGDDGAKLLAEALAGNKSLKRLEFSETDSRYGLFPGSGITATGWSAFTRLLCDTSSINKTYLSNHTLGMCTKYYRYNPFGRPLPVIAPPDVEYYLALNRDHEQASIYKILSEHPEFDMKPLLQQWQLKFLPLMVAWFKTARASQHLMRFDMFTSIDVLLRRELSAIYQFMRGLPSLTVSGYLDRKMTGPRSKKRKQKNIDSFFNQVERPLQRRNLAQETNEQAE